MRSRYLINLGTSRGVPNMAVFFSTVLLFHELWDKNRLSGDSIGARQDEEYTNDVCHDYRFLSFHLQININEIIHCCVIVELNIIMIRYLRFLH